MEGSVSNAVSQDALNVIVITTVKGVVESRIISMMVKNVSCAI